MSRKFLAIGACGIVLLLTAGCRQDMHNQPKYIPLRQTDFFASHRSERPLVRGTVARGQLREDTLLYTGMADGHESNEFPYPVTEAMVQRGQDRFNIYCSPCHGRTGRGDGMVVRRGFHKPPSYFDSRLMNAPVGHFFDVITNGYGAMQDYKMQVPVRDRWAIAAYIRALQLSEHATLNDVPPDERAKLNAQGPAGTKN